MGPRPANADTWLQAMRRGGRDFDVTVWYRFASVINASWAANPVPIRKIDDTLHRLLFQIEILHVESGKEKVKRDRELAAAQAEKAARERAAQIEKEKADKIKQAEQHIKRAARKVEFAKRFLEKGDAETAKKWLREMITKYGDTPSAKDADALLKAIK